MGLFSTSNTYGNPKDWYNGLGGTLRTMEGIGDSYRNSAYAGQDQFEVYNPQALNATNQAAEILKRYATHGLTDQERARRMGALGAGTLGTSLTSAYNKARAHLAGRGLGNSSINPASLANDYAGRLASMQAQEGAYESDLPLQSYQQLGDLYSNIANQGYTRYAQGLGGASNVYGNIAGDQLNAANSIAQANAQAEASSGLGGLLNAVGGFIGGGGLNGIFRPRKKINKSDPFSNETSSYFQDW